MGKDFKCGNRTFEHTADIGLEAWSETREGLFEEAAKGLFGLIVDLSGVKPGEKIRVRLQAENTEELFLKWLQELLFISDSKHLLLSSFRIGKIEANELTAEVAGEKLDPASHRLGREVKAVTRHQFEWKEEVSGLRARVILDI